MQNHKEYETIQYAGFWMRVAAHMIDFVIVMIALGIINSVLSPVMKVLEETPFGGEIIFQFTLMDMIEYILTVVYFIIMTYFTGATLGKRIMKLKVISANDDEKLNIFTVIYRETIGRYLSDAFCGIGYLTVAFTKDKKAIHDMLCDTRVVEVRRKKAVYASEKIESETVSGVDMIPKMVEEADASENLTTDEYVKKQWEQIIERDS